MKELLLIEENGRQQLRLQLRDEADVIAIDLSSRLRLQLKVAQLSAYRHLLCTEGKSFRILNILDLKAQAIVSGARPTTACRWRPA